MPAISKYTIDVAYRFDRRSIGQIDKAMRDLEKKIKGFSNKLKTKMTFSIEKFDVDQRKLNFALGNALDRASNSVVFHISRFNIDQSRLNAVMARAMANANRTSSGARAGASPVIINNKVLSGSEWDRREAEKQKLWWERRNALREDEARRAAERAARPVKPGNYYNRSSINTMFGGGVAGLSARFPMATPLLALAGGGYGLGQLNQRNQQVVSAQLQTAAVVQQAGGTAQQGAQSFDFLRAQANRIGFNYLDASGDYNKLISGLTGAGVGLQDSQNVFKGFAELARVNKLDKTQQNRLFRALSQVAGKGKLQAEELTGQIARILALEVERLLENLSKCWELKLA